MIEFIWGRAGSGKTSRVCEAAAKSLCEGRQVFFIVPEQMAVDAETRMANLLGDAPSLSLEILNFRRLCNRVFREYGGLSYSYVTKSGRMLMMWRELCELAPMLKSGIGADRNSVSRMLGAINELKAYCVTPRALERAADTLSVDDKNSRFADKLYDLSLIYAAYTNLVAETCDDAADDLTKAAELLSKNGFFDGAHVCLDSFYGFTPQEFRVIEAIFRQAENVTVSLCLDESDYGLFENQKNTADRLMELAKPRGDEIRITTLSQNLRTAVPELEFIESKLWSLDLTEDNAYKDDVTAIKLIECSSLFAECEAVASDICRRVREGAEWRDFAITTRGIERYDGILDVILEKYGIPHFVSRRVDIKTKPLIKLILTALSLRASNFRTADVISYIKTGLCGITPDEVSLLENYAETWSIRSISRWSEDFTMNPMGYTTEFTETALNTLAKVNDIRERVMTPLIDLYDALGRSTSVKDYSRSLYGYLLALDIPAKLDAAAVEKRSSDPAAAQEYEQLWSVLIDALDEVCRIMPELEVDAETYAELLKIIFDETDIGRIPGSVDEVVSGDASLLRASCRHMYIIGANEGVFPCAPADNGMFCDSERELLAGVGVNLAGGTDYQAADERFFFYRALSSASESVTVLWSGSELSGRSMKPSFGAVRLRSLFPKLDVIDYASLPAEQRLEGRANLLEFTAECAGTPLGAALFEYAGNDPELRERAARLSLPLCDDDESLSEETAKLLFGGDLALTQYRLEAYVLCRFSYFCKYILKLDEIKKAEFDAADIGTFVHSILESFVKRAKENGTLCELTETELDEMVDEIIADYVKRIGSIASDLTGSRLAHLFARLRRSSRLLCRNLAAEFAQSRFHPAFFELPIRFPSPDEETVEPLCVKLDDGSDAYVYGITDRVDVMCHEDKYYVRVVDYKTGTKEFSLDDVSMGLDMQMLLYLFSIWKNGQSPRSALKIPENCEIIPAGVLYFSAGVPTVTLDAEMSPEAVEQLVSKKLARNGLLLDDEAVLRAMEGELAGHYLPIRIKKDGGFTKTESLTSLDGFKTLLSSIEDTVKRIGGELKKGSASAKPFKNKKYDACKYCTMRPICRKPRNGGVS